MGDTEVTSTQSIVYSTADPFSLVLEQRVTLMVYLREAVEAVPLSMGHPVVFGRDGGADVVVPRPSLSRRHARFELLDDGVMLEDLDSTNGTRVNGEPVTRCKVKPGEDVMLGDVRVALHVHTPSEGQVQGLSTHERFLTILDEELMRHREFGRKLGLLMVRVVGGDGEHLSRWLPMLRGQLRRVDRMALYSPDCVEIALPEVTADSLLATANAVVESRQASSRPLLCGAALFPDNATSPDELQEQARGAVQAATAEQPVVTSVQLADRTPSRPGSPVVTGEAMQKVFDSVKRLARANIPVLITGETGTGKEVVARSVHTGSPRKDAAFVCVNCAALPEQLVESILFGHEKGAFTGADRRTEGVFKDADGGTVFLDEIGELIPAAQAALLRVLETQKVNRVGSSKEVSVDVRVLCATHRNIPAMCEAGSFRWDLFYRINTMTLKIPPLRERVDEIGPLAKHFLAEASGAEYPVSGIDPQAMKVLSRYNWPGNVRELRNVIERAVVMAQGDRITPNDLPDSFRDRPSPRAGAEDGLLDDDVDYKTRIQRYEKKLILAALTETDGNQTQAAKKLRIPLRTLVFKIRNLGVLDE